MISLQDQLWEKVKKSIFTWMDLGKLEPERAESILAYVRSSLEESPADFKAKELIAQWAVQFPEMKFFASIVASENAECLEKIAVESTEASMGTADLEEMVKNLEAVEENHAGSGLEQLAKQNPELAAFVQDLEQNGSLFQVKSLDDIHVVLAPGLFAEDGLQLAVTHN